jgi:protein SCO1/2
MPRPLIWLLIAAPAVMMIAFFTLMLTANNDPVERRAGVRVSGEADIGGPFTLVDHTGTTVTDADFHGRAMLIYFGYTYCPDICPFSLQIMGAALDQLDPAERARIQPVLITVDPRRDTVEQLARYVTSPAFPDGLVGLTGTEEQIAEAAGAYRIVYRRAETEEAGDYLMDHSSIVYLMDGEGEFVDIFTHGTDPQAMAARLQDFLEEEGAS